MTPVSPKAQRILVVDDEPKFGQIVSTFLMGRGYQVAIAQNSSEALAQLEQFNPAVVLLDIVMPGLSGLEVLKLTRLRPFPPRVIIVTSADAEQVAPKAILDGAEAYMSKPIDLNALERLISGIWPSSPDSS